MDAIETVTTLSPADAEAAIRASLADHGFGVLTEIDVAATFKAKLGIDGKPAIPTASRTDELYRALRGQCIFFGTASDGLPGCTIYGARPTECSRYVCTNAPADNPTHEQIARLWMPPKEA